MFWKTALCCPAQPTICAGFVSVSKNLKMAATGSIIKFNSYMDSTSQTHRKEVSIHLFCCRNHHPVFFHPSLWMPLAPTCLMLLMFPSWVMKQTTQLREYQECHSSNLYYKYSLIFEFKLFITQLYVPEVDTGIFLSFFLP